MSNIFFLNYIKGVKSIAIHKLIILYQVLSNQNVRLINLIVIKDVILCNLLFISSENSGGSPNRRRQS